MVFRIEFKDNISYFFLKSYVETSHKNRLRETVLMRDHRIRFEVDIWKTVP